MPSPNPGLITTNAERCRAADHRLGIRSRRPVDGEVARRFELLHEGTRSVGLILVHDGHAQGARPDWLCSEKTKPNRTATITGQTNVKKKPDLTRSRIRRSLTASATIRCISESWVSVC